MNGMSRSRGFTIVEALAALAVMAFGMVAVISMQGTLSRNADVSKQRTEAMRLAQERLESLRSFTGIATGGLNWDGLSTALPGATSCENVTAYTVGTGSTSTNATYCRRYALTGSVNDASRTATVTVTWTDRAGDTQRVALSSVLSKSDPSNTGIVGFPLPQNTNLKRPKNRSLNIPIQAVDLGGGKSAYQFSSNYAIIFSDASGYVIEKCNTTVTASSYANGTAGCAEFDGFILAGYVSGAVTPSSGTPTRPTGINTRSIAGWDNSGGKVISCAYGQARNQNTGVAIANFHYYVCVIPVAVNGSWSGTVRLGGIPAGSSGYNVCRFQYAESAFAGPNARNVQPYVNVKDSLDNQNYYITNANACPSVASNTGSVGTPSDSAIAGSLQLQTTMHQQCRDSAAATLTGPTDRCPATAHNTGE